MRAAGTPRGAAAMPCCPGTSPAAPPLGSGRSRVSLVARSQAGESTVTFSSGLGHPAPANAPRTSARPRAHAGPYRSRPAVSIFSPVVCVVVATLGNSRHGVWPTGFCQDR
ncbi:hypothetical protein NDU88_004637 [Pleurodeles waltl]|uniref:Secreted protein n=1 Tax=Pleurodeles waltl TaxID=8319 RepID=A0AAV7SJH9_PLEWA|nr:hypothetical protein NDU88_004637 [Pleurodeles waltl]